MTADKEKINRVKRWEKSSGLLKQAFDDGEAHGRDLARKDILDYLATDFILNSKLERHSPKYDAALEVIRDISARFAHEQK